MATQPQPATGSNDQTGSGGKVKPTEASQTPEAHAEPAKDSTPPATELENVISLPILRETPSSFNMLTNSNLQCSNLVVDKDESSTGAPSQPVLSTIRGKPALDLPETTFTDAPTRNYVLSAVSLVEGHCGSAPAAKPPATSSKRLLINVRYLLDSTVQPVGILLGSIHCYLNCLYVATHVFVRAALVRPEGAGAAKAASDQPENDVALDFCQVSETDSSKVGKVYQVENKRK